MAEESYSKNWLTPKNILLYLVVGAIVYGLVYYLFLGNKGTSVYTTPPTGQAEQSTYSSGMEVVLSEKNDSGENGVATLTESGGQTTVTIALNNASESGEQPAHIHTGACPTPSAVTYPLTNVVNGSSVTVLDVSLEKLRSQLPLAVNVHKSAADIKTYVSCGDLQ